MPDADEGAPAIDVWAIEAAMLAAAGEDAPAIIPAVPIAEDGTTPWPIGPPTAALGMPELD